jgi:hypothetical protein
MEEFLKPLQPSQSRVALDIGLHPRGINELVLGKWSITADTAPDGPHSASQACSKRGTRVRCAYSADD